MLAKYVLYDMQFLAILQLVLYLAIMIDIKGNPQRLPYKNRRIPLPISTKLF